MAAINGAPFLASLFRAARAVTAPAESLADPVGAWEILESDGDIKPRCEEPTVGFTTKMDAVIALEVERLDSA
jgi:hypothetical protein